MSLKVIRAWTDYGGIAQYLKSYDPDGGPLPYPTGAATYTDDPSEALHFVDTGSALAFWRQESTRTPQRPDGRPNRPLTAVTISIEDAP